MPKRTEADERDLIRLPDNLFFRTAMLNFLMGRTLSPFYGAEGLLSHEWKVLGVLWSFEPLSASEILQQVTFDKAAVSRALRSLEERELIVRQSQSQDRRSANVRLTRRGQQVYRRILAQVSAVQEEMLAGLTQAQTDTLFQVHDILETYLRRRLEPDATD